MFGPRVLCETVKDFVARVGKAYEKNTENSEESEAMAKKVGLLVQLILDGSSGRSKSCLVTLWCFVMQCSVLKEKLDSLLKTLNEESQASTELPPAPPPTIAEEHEELEVAALPAPLHPAPPPHTPCSPRTTSTPLAAAAIFKPREQLMLRANSLKKAIRQIIEHTEKGKLPACPAESDE